MRNDKPNLIVDLTFQFSLDIIEYCEMLYGLKKFVFSYQILKAGTSIGANVREAQNAESRSDFVHKMKISAKEADEVEYFLLLCQRSPFYPNCDKLLIHIGEILKILNKIISSSKGS